jgi:pimeloyl-ACP methyl ester carboxylesterase
MDFGHIDRTEVDAQVAAMQADFPATVAGIVEATATELTDADLKARLIDEMSRTRPEPAMAAWEALLTWDPLPAFQALDTPVAYIQNGNMHPDARERYARFLVSDRTMPGHGHFLHMEDPVRFCDLLEQAVAELIAT